VINDVSVASDLIILPDSRIIDNWYRQQGHLLQAYDIKNLIISDPDILVIGTGASGMMKLDRKLSQQLINKGIQVDILPFIEAIEKFNTHTDDGKKVAAYFHLSC
jgi:hypothetical protein